MADPAPQPQEQPPQVPRPPQDAVVQNIRDFKIYDAVVNENASKQQCHWLKVEK